MADLLATVLTISRAEAYQAYADALRRSVATLTETEKQTAILNHVMETLDESLEGSRIMSENEKWAIGEPGGPAGPFYSVVTQQGRIIAMQIPDRNVAEQIAAIPELLGACELDSSFESDGPALLDHAAYELEQRAPDLQLLVDELRRKAALERTAIAKARGEVA